MLRIRPIEHVVSKITTRQLSTSNAVQNDRPRDPTPPTVPDEQPAKTFRIRRRRPPRAPLIPSVLNPAATQGPSEKRLGNNWNAFITPPKTRIQKEDNEHNEPGHDGLANKPIAIKDNICTKEYPTTCASAILKDFKSPYDATVVRLLKEAGAHISGKTNMDEFGMGSHSTHSHFGAVISAEGLSVGGSSGGSAVAVRSHANEAWAYVELSGHQVQELIGTGH